MNHSVRPTSAVGWWAFWLGLAATVWGLFFTFLVQTAGNAIRNSGYEPAFRIPIGMTSAILPIVLGIAALVAGFLAFRRGDRSVLMFLGFALAAIFGGFWVLFALGELLTPY